MPSMTITMDAPNYLKVQNILVTEYAIPTVDGSPEFTDDEWVKLKIKEILTDKIKGLGYSQEKRLAVAAVIEETPIISVGD